MTRKIDSQRTGAFLKRKFKPTSIRPLAKGDILVLDFLWTWKVASSSMLKLVGYNTKSDWWAYKAIRRIEKEKYIQRLPRGKFLDQEIWTLTQAGFEIVLMDRDDIDQYRYRPHSPAHDHLATCLQLGSLWQTSWEKQFFTEQMLSCLNENNFPDELVQSKSHIPDGVTVLRHGQAEAVIGYEVDLNLKNSSRYHQTIWYYYHIKKCNLVVWLVRNPWICERIQRVIESDSYGKELAPFIGFILLEDFKKNVWNAKFLNGNYVGQSVCKVHENVMQKLSKDTANLSQKPMQDIFFPKFKSPQKSNTSKRGALHEKS